MIRLIIGFALILALVAGGAWMADHPGHVQIDFEDFVVETSFAALSFVVAGLLVLACLVFWAWIWLRHDAPLIGKNRVIKRQQRGLDQLNEAMLSLAAGNAADARKHIKRAELLLPPEPMVQLIAAEAATRDGDHASAAEHYRTLEKDPRARFIGLRGLLVDAKRAGHTQEALSLAREALLENSKSHWALESVFSLEVTAGDWQAAQETLNKAQKLKLYDGEQAKAHRGALCYAQAVEQAMAGDLTSARASLKSALKDRPGFTPAVTRLARMDVADGHPKRAERGLKAGWKVAPHPDIAATLLSINPTASASEMKEKIRQLTMDQADHPASLLIRAEMAKDVNALAEAKNLLENLLLTSNSRAAWTMMAELDDLMNSDNQRALDMARAAMADPSWVCDTCHSPANHWAALCEVCGSFDSISWRSFTAQEKEISAIESEAPMTLLQENLVPPRPNEG